MASVNRELFLSQLDSVYPGISPKEIIEQSSCFVFHEGKVITFNDEVACRNECIAELSGAVQADPLLKILRKLEEEELDIEYADGELLIKGKRKKSGIRMEADITLPIDKIEEPGKWTSLHPEFTEAIDIVKNTASKDQTSFNLTCVHITPDSIQSTDDTQVSCYKIDTGFDLDISSNGQMVSGGVLLRRESVQHIVGLGMSKYSITKSWIHFKNKRGLIFSCRRYNEDYPDISRVLKVKGTKTQLPKGLAKSAENADIFSSENDDNKIIVELKPGKVKITGQGVSGWHSELRNMNYEGPKMKFMIAPQLLSRISTQHNECQIADGALKVVEGKFTYVTCLHHEEEKPEAKDE